MEKKIIQKPVFQTVKTGEKAKTVYVANDGREFDHEKDCVEWERMIDIIANGEKELTKISFEDEDILELISRYAFGASFDSSNICFWKWTATKDGVKIKAVIDYLKQLGRREVFYSSKTFDFPEGSTVIISSWVESEHSDYPTHCTEAVQVSAGMDIIETLTRKLKSAWQQLI